MNRKEVRELVDRLLGYQRAYYVEGKPLVSDLEYDRLFDMLKRIEEENPSFVFPDSPTLRVGSDLTNDFSEVRHTIPVLSLDKAYSTSEVLAFFEKNIRKEESMLSFVAEEKIDGVSMVLYYENGILVRAVTRGNGEVGNDVTPNIRTIGSVPLSLPEPLTIAVRGEVFIRKEDFERINSTLEDDEKSANARNLAAGAIRRQKSGEAKLVPLDIFCYEGFWRDEKKTPEDHLHILAKLKELGFKTDPDIAYFASTKEKAEEALSSASLAGRCYAFSQMEEYIKYKTDGRKDLPYEIDGLVFKVNELDVRARLGYTEHHPRWAIAYKFESPEAVSKLLSITCQVGRTGRITPVAELNPVQLGGSTIKRATLHNQEYIDSLELAIGDTVSIVKRGDVIPQVEDVLEKNDLGNTTYEIPPRCPSCNTELGKEGAHIFCPNKKCPDQIVGNIAFFSSRTQMDIESLGPKTIRELYEKGMLESISDIYTADYASLLGQPGFGEKTVSQIISAVEESKKQPFKIVLSSLGISELGKKSAEMLISGGFDSFEKLENAKKEDLVKIPGIGEQMAGKIISAFSDEEFLSLLAKLTAAGLSTSVEDDSAESLKVDDSLSGTLWCVTGSFEHFNPRSKALDEIEKRGGRTGSSITGKTTHLLAGKGGGSKREQAEKLGVKVVGEDEFLAMIGMKKAEDEGGQLSLF